MDKLGFHHITGVDYSETAIELCKKIKSNQSQIIFQTSDILNPCKEFLVKFDLAIDKGTFDAISLYGKDSTNVSHTTLYVHQINEILKPNGMIIINSCNWTFEELLTMFEESIYKITLEFLLVEKVESAKSGFTFGGSSGNSTTCVVFKKRL